MPADLVYVFLAALATALATGLGALPLLWLRSTSDQVMGIANAAAGGLMLAASQMLIVEGAHISLTRTIWGIAGGAVAIWLLARIIHIGDRDLGDDGEAPLAGRFRSASARSALLIIAVMTAHSAAEGIGVGVSFGGGEQLGLLVTIAIAVHNIPEGLAISLTMVPQGATVRSAAGWSIFSSLPQPILAIPAYLFVEAFHPVLPIGLGIAAGGMIWMVASELMPDALRKARWDGVVAGTVAGYLVMLGFTMLLR